MEAYESSIDAQTLDVKRLEIQQCAYLNCGYTFLDIHCHYWQFHSNYIKPNMKEASHTMIQESNAIEGESRPGGDTENIESGKTQSSQDMSSIQSTENHR